MTGTGASPAAAAPAEAGPGERRAVAAAALILVVAALALFHETVFGGRQFFYRDLALQWHPQAEAFVRAVKSGAWPVWNPYVSFGMPLLANPNNEILYPITWLHLLVSAWTFYTIYTVFHFVLAGLGTYVLGRHLGLSRPAAIVAGLLWVLSGPFLSLVNLWAHMAAAAWMPWIAWAGDRALVRPDRRRAVVWGALVAVTVLCGSPELGAMAAAATLVLAIRHLPGWRRHPGQARAAALAAIGAGVFALALSAGQSLPSLELARGSMRSRMPASAREYWSIHPATLAQAAFPVFPDRLPLHGTWRERWYESREPYLLSLYLGLPAGALVLAGLAGARSRPWVAPVASMVVLAMLVALGRHGPVYEAMVTLLPPLRTLRFPAKGMILASFGVALLAGHGFDVWRGRRLRPLAFTLIALAVAIAAAAALAGGALVSRGAEEWGSALLLRGRRSYAEVLHPVASALLASGALAAIAAAAALATRFARTRAAVTAWLVAAVAILDLTLAQRGLNPTAPRGVLAGTPPVIEAAAPADHQRLFVFDYTRQGTAASYLGHRPYVTALREEDWDPWHGQLALRTYAYPSMLALWGREGSYGIDAVNLLSADVMTLNSLMDMFDGTPSIMHRLFRLGAVDAAVALHSKGFEELTPAAVLPSPFLEPIRVFRVPDALPRAYVVGRARVAPVGMGWRALLAPDFDPAREIVLPEGPVLESDAPGGTARIVEMRADSVTIEADLAAPAYVVLVDAYDPGWKATIDGQDTRVLRANVAFRAVQAPAGRHRIRLEYRPASVPAGLAITGLAVVAGLLAFRRRPTAAAEAS